MSNRRLISLRISLVAKLAASLQRVLPGEAGLFDRFAALRGLVREPADDADQRRRAAPSRHAARSRGASPAETISAAPSRPACGRAACRTRRRGRCSVSDFCEAFVCRPTAAGSRRLLDEPHQLMAFGERRERGDDFGRVGVAIVRPLGRHLLRGSSHRPRGIGCGDWIGGSFSRSCAFSGRRSDSQNGGLPGQQVIQRAAQAVDVGPNVDAGGLPLLGRHVHRRAHRPVVEQREPLLIVAHQQRQAEVEDLHDGPLAGRFGRRRRGRCPKLSLETTVSIRFDGLMSRWTMPC